MDSTVTVIGNITRDPELRFTKGGAGVCSISLAVNRRWQNRQSGEWDESVSFFDATLWGDLAENAAGSLEKGQRVIVTGRLEQQSWETNEGERRSRVVIVADEIGPSLRWATAKVTKTARKEDDRPVRSTAVEEPEGAKRVSGKYDFRQVADDLPAEEPESEKRASARPNGRLNRPAPARKRAPEPELDEDPYDEVPF